MRNTILLWGRPAITIQFAGAALGTLIARDAEFITTFVYILVMDKSLGVRIQHKKLHPKPFTEAISSWERLCWSVIPFLDLAELLSQ